MNLKSVGNYVIDVEQLRQFPVVISGGVGGDLRFEQAMIEEYQANLCAYDFTPLAVAYCAKMKLPGLVLYEEGISAKPTFEYFITESYDAVSSSEYVGHPNKRKEMKTATAACVNIATLLDRHGNLDVLKLDIEGSEFDLIDEMTLEQAQRIDQVCMETHDHIIPKLHGREKILLSKMASLGFCAHSSGVHEWLFSRSA
jgi:FkbM family methyltransferase